MISITRGYIKEMGTTGEGITSAEEINMSLDNAFVNKWSMLFIQAPIPIFCYELIILLRAYQEQLPMVLGDARSYW